MLFGSKATFAIEAMTEPHLIPPSAVWGRMQVWCRGGAIGDFSEECCALFGPYEGFRNLLRSLPKLWFQEFEGLSDLQLWNRLDGLLYFADDDRTLEQCSRDWEQYGQCNFLTNWGEQFDGNGKSFIVCAPSGVVHILNQSLPNGISCEVPLLDVLAAANEYASWFESEQARLASSSG